MSNSPSRAVCTVVARNYLPYARVLARSLRARSPGTPLHVLVLDGAGAELPGDEELFVRHGLEVLDLPDARRMPFSMSVVEFATAVKPWLLDHLLGRAGCEKVLFLDPDILVLRSLDPIFDALDDAPILLTPHARAPFPDDGCAPHEYLLLLHGGFNLGFLGLRAHKEARDLLAWWKRMTPRYCFHDYGHGLFVDQKLFDVAVHFFPGARIVRDPGWNAAFWNLHERTVTRKAGQWFAGGQPLVFFHFSAFNASVPECPAPGVTRPLFVPGSGPRKLFAIYARLLRREKARQGAGPEYGFQRFPGGERIRLETRQWFRRSRAGQSHPDPFTWRRARLVNRLFFARWFFEAAWYKGCLILSRWLRRISLFPAIRPR